MDSSSFQFTYTFYDQGWFVIDESQQAAQKPDLLDRFNTKEDWDSLSDDDWNYFFLQDDLSDEEVIALFDELEGNAHRNDVMFGFDDSIFFDISKNFPEVNGNVLDISGKYECMLYNGNGKNDWHYVTITANEIEDQYTWKNKAEVSWDLVQD